jgi:uncharacterized protein (DUF885 family)
MARQLSWLVVLGISVLCLSGCNSERQSESLRLQQLFEDDWEFGLREAPLFATHYGDHRYDDKLSLVSEADEERRNKQVRVFQDRLHAVDRTSLSEEQQLNYDLFERNLDNAIGWYEYQTYLMPITHMGGFHTSFAQLPERVPLDTVKDYENYIERLRSFKKWSVGHIELMKKGIDNGYVLSKIVAKDIEGSIKPHIVADANKSLLYEPFEKFPERITDADRKRLIENGSAAIIDSVVPGYELLLKFITEEYVPASRSSISASSLPNGRAYYEFCVRYYTTTDLTPEQIYNIGLAEVDRIKLEMNKIISDTGFEGNFDEFIEFLRTDKRFYVDSPEALLKEVAFLSKKIDGQVLKLFKTLPRMPFGIKEVPDYTAPESPMAYYHRPAGDGRRAGFYYINTFKAKTFPLYELEALSMHEAIPGHHLQAALQQELEGIPEFRRFAWFTAYGEGWALYAERLGLEMDLYQDPYSNFGRLMLEIWRACRLVVDTGMHYKGWSRQQAIDFMVHNAGLAREAVTTEVDRYIVWPGQALAYKIGQLKIIELRGLAERELGDDFDVRLFHDAVLSSGPVPLDVLEKNIKAWIDKVKKI